MIKIFIIKHEKETLVIIDNDTGNPITLGQVFEKYKIGENFSIESLDVQVIILKMVRLITRCSIDLIGSIVNIILWVFRL
jgi:hypothetical protein